MSLNMAYGEDIWLPGQPVPAYREHLPDIELATGAQRAYYAWLSTELADGRTSDVAGFSSYPFAYAYAAVFEFKGDRDYRRLASTFELLLAGYSETFSPRELSFLRNWRCEAAALCALWGEAWAQRSGLPIVDLARTVSTRLGSSPRLTATDLSAAIFGGPKLTQHGKNNRAAVDDAVQLILDETHDAAGRNLFDDYCDTFDQREGQIGNDRLAELVDELEYRVEPSRLRQAIEQQSSLVRSRTLLERTGDPPYVTVKYYFGADGIEFNTEEAWHRAADELQARRMEEATNSTDNRPLAIRMVSTYTGGHGTRRIVAAGHSREERTATFDSCSALAAVIIETRAEMIFREAENYVREAQGLPRVGEGWFSETKLYVQLRENLTGHRVQQHARPKWLTPQHFDVYLPEPNIAIEFQGSQHFEPVDFFGGESTFAKQQERDARKRSTCKANGCHLIEVRAGYDLEALLGEIRTTIARRLSP